MKFALLAAAALTGSTANAEIYFKEQFNDDVSFHFGSFIIFFAMPPIRRSTANAALWERKAFVTAPTKMMALLIG
jgi:hypothetical protein